jgi:hypothetical protein
MFKRNLLAVLVAEKEFEAECEARAQRVVKPTVVELPGMAERGSHLFRQGTIMFFVAESRNPTIKRIRTAITKGDHETLDRLGPELQKMELDGLARSSREPSFAADHLVNIHYDKQPLARGMVPSLVSVAVSRAVWNGGALKHNNFVAFDYVRDSAHPEVEVLVVLVAPRLSELEQAILRAVPNQIDEVYVKGPSLSWTPVVQAGLVSPFGEREGSPLFQRIVERNTQQQVQQQQEDTQRQQQQQQQQQADRQAQQQQQQQQDLNQNQQQQQQQQQDVARTQQQQQQQQQDAQTQQRQQQNQQDAQTRQQQQEDGSSRSWLDDRQGLELGPFIEDDYLELLRATDFTGLDATQSAKMLLRLREQLILRGLP